MVLSNYAGIFILVIMIAGIGLLMFAANKMGKPASVIFIVALIGAYIGPEICESRDFKDSSIETIVTLTLMPHTEHLHIQPRFLHTEYTRSI